MEIVFEICATLVHRLARPCRGPLQTTGVIPTNETLKIKGIIQEIHNDDINGENEQVLRISTSYFRTMSHGIVGYLSRDEQSTGRR